MAICTDEFATLARAEATGWGLARIAHGRGAAPARETRHRSLCPLRRRDPRGGRGSVDRGPGGARGEVPRQASRRTAGASATTPVFDSAFNAPDAPDRFRGPDSVEALNRLFVSRGWTDGLPVLPPTPQRTEAMLGGRDANELAALVEPRLGRATLGRRHGRERGHGRLRGGPLPHRAGRHARHVRSRVQSQGHPVDDASLYGRLPGGRSGVRVPGHQRGVQRLRPGQPGQRGHRSCDPADSHQYRGRVSRRAGPFDDGLARETYVLLRRERGREPVAVLARRAGTRSRCEPRHGVRRRGTAQCQRPLRTHRRRDPPDRGGHARVARRKQLLPRGTARGGARPGARRGHRRRRLLKGGREAVPVRPRRRAPATSFPRRCWKCSRNACRTT